MKPSRRIQGPDVFELIEEATHRLRTAPASTLAVYYAGAVPFVLSLLFFWADMSRNPFAPDHLAPASLGLVPLFLWMKFCQAVFARRLRDQVAGTAPQWPALRAAARLFFRQTVIQPTGLFLLPLALLTILPGGWVCAFYQNATVLDDGAEAGAGALTKKSAAQATLWPRQNHLLLLLFFAFAFCVFLNCITICLYLPQFGKMVLGLDSDFSRSPLAMLNSTFLAAMCALTYLCVDPLLKTIYTLRCFYGEALQSGADLKAALKPFLAVATKSTTGLLLCSAIFAAAPAPADTTPPPVSSALHPLAVPELDHQLDRTIHQDKYLWRMPRKAAAPSAAEPGLITRFFTAVQDWFYECLHTIGRWLHELLRHLFGGRRMRTSSDSGYGWIMLLQVLLYGLLATVVLVLAWLIWRLCVNRPAPTAACPANPILPPPDLADENVRADQLPEDGWTRLARELLARGEYRLAMRAFHLAALARLAAANLITIARSKSNHDYERELRRRAHSFPELLAAFRHTLPVFERVWYGTHQASAELVAEFEASVEKLKAGG